ncbi:MAG: conjugal transfer protein TraF [Burkholderiales bacterium]|nr:conjugal transfer protein TraF [Burkholderiales bacterium]
MQKSNFRKSLSIVLALLISQVYCSEDAQKGWFYYEQPPQIESEIVTPQYNSYKQALEAAKAEYSEVEARAIIDPTPSNVKAYRDAMQLISDKSARLAMLASTQSWQDPNSRLSQFAMGGSGGQQDLDNMRAEDGEIIKKYGIFYFYSKDCKYCNVEANELKRLENTYGIHVVTVSMDGSLLSQFPDAINDNGFSANLNIDKPGALVAFDSIKKKAITIGYGYMHFDEIIKRIQALFVSGTGDPSTYINSKLPVKIDK